MTILSDTGKPIIIPQSVCCKIHSDLCGVSGYGLGTIKDKTGIHQMSKTYYCCDKCPEQPWGKDKVGGGGGGACHNYIDWNCSRCRYCVFYWITRFHWLLLFKKLLTK